MSASDSFHDKTTQVNQCGRLTSLTSKSMVGGGITSQQYWTITLGLLLTGSCAQP